MLLSVERLNKYLVCTLCDGYFREAHTVPECLHTFCKECLFAEFQRGARTCPTCGTALGLNAESKVVYDRNLQSCVDKLFPEFVAREQERLRVLDSSSAVQADSSSAQDPAHHHPEVASTEPAPAVDDASDENAPEDSKTNQITVRLSPASHVPELVKLPALKKMTLETHIQVKVGKIQNFVRKRLLEDGFDIEASEIALLFEYEQLDAAQDLSQAATKWGLVSSACQDLHLLLTYCRNQT